MCLTSIRIDHKRQRPGWPAEVSLPVDPLWKSQYAARIGRLVRAGVDPPLANLFVHVAKPPDLKAEGAERARSSTVQLRRSFIAGWKHCPKTAGCFRLNAELPIPFDGWAPNGGGLAERRIPNSNRTGWWSTPG